MTARLRPKRFGDNQNYIQRNKDRNPHYSAPIVGNVKNLTAIDSETGEEVDVLTDEGLPLTNEGELLTDG